MTITISATRPRDGAFTTVPVRRAFGFTPLRRGRAIVAMINPEICMAVTGSFQMNSDAITGTAIARRRTLVATAIPPRPISACINRNVS
ncbi:MAG: hypothetical protein EBT22_09400 [Chloroflexi bacterium]|nr:hypothetical protein [Chloroflexota bacterium]